MLTARLDVSFYEIAGPYVGLQAYAGVGHEGSAAGFQLVHGRSGYAASPGCRLLVFGKALVGYESVLFDVHDHQLLSEQRGRSGALRAYNAAPCLDFPVRSPSRPRALAYSSPLVALTSLSAALRLRCAPQARRQRHDSTLEKAEVKTMSVDIRRQQKTIRPRDSVQMAIFADVVLDGDKAAEAGRDVARQEGRQQERQARLRRVRVPERPGRLRFVTVGSRRTRNLLTTVGKEFSIKSVYRRRPDKFSFTTTYKPDYSCIKEGGGGGGVGRKAPSGATALGQGGASGSSSSAGGEGADGGSGTSGGSGGDGTAGPKLTVYATW